MLGGPRQVKLLAFLLFNANRAVSADALIDAVWGAEWEGAAKRLRMGVLRLRKALAPVDTQDGSRLRTVSGGYLLEVGLDELDAEAFAERRSRDWSRACSIRVNCNTTTDHLPHSTLPPQRDRCSP